MYLLERQRKILGLLLANEQRMTGSQIAQMIGITDRTVRNDIKDLNEGLKEYPDSYVESIRGKGYLLVSKHKEELLKQVEQSNSNETTKGSNRQIMMRPDIKLPQPFASWSNSL